jgi:hypothetical protein
LLSFIEEGGVDACLFDDLGEGCGGGDGGEKESGGLHGDRGKEGGAVKMEGKQYRWTEHAIEYEGALFYLTISCQSFKFEVF